MLPEFGFENPELLYLYLRSGAADGLIGADASQTGSEPRAPDVVPPEELSAVDSDTVIQCEHCGADNEPKFRYCRNCVADLGRGLSTRSSGDSQSQRRPF